MGWVRINLHYTFEDKDIDYLLNAIAFVAEYGNLFLGKYRFIMATGEWIYAGFKEKEKPFSIDNEFASSKIDRSSIDNFRSECLEEAESLVRELQREPEPQYQIDNTAIEEIKFFHIPLNTEAVKEI